MRKKREHRALGFRVSIEFLNLVFDLIKKRKYKLIPKDARIHAIRHEDMMYDGYTIIVTSKEFPIVAEGCTCYIGDVKEDRKRGIIELKELDSQGSKM